MATKMVDGAEVELSAEEEQALLEDQARIQAGFAARVWQQVKPALDAELRSRRDKLQAVCNGLALQFLAINEPDHFKLALRMVERLKDVSPKNPGVAAATTEAGYRQAVKVLYAQAINLAVADTWPDDPEHAIPEAVEIEFKRYAE